MKVKQSDYFGMGVEAGGGGAVASKLCDLVSIYVTNSVTFVFGVAGLNRSLTVLFSSSGLSR